MCGLNNLKGKRVLVTGARGYLAGHLITGLSNLHSEIYALSRGESDSYANVQWIHSDITKVSWPEILRGMDFVFHLAGQTSARIADQNPETDYQVNVQPVFDLIEAAEAFPNLSVLFAGTVTQCGIPNRTPVNETHPDTPITTYDRHKLSAERALLQAAASKKIRAASLRLCNLYGPGQNSMVKDRGILNQMVARAVQGEPLTLIKECGSFVRDYLYVTDAAAAFIEAAAAMDKISGSYFVIGSGAGHTLSEVFQKVASRASQKLSRTVEILPLEAPVSPIDRRHFVADSSLFRKQTAWFPRVSLDRGIELMIEELSCVS